MDPVTAYAEEVLAGNIIAGPHVRATCERHLKDLKEGEKRGLLFDEEKAARALNFFPDILRLAGGVHEGKPFVLLPWQEFIVGSLFGWQQWNEGDKAYYRRFRIAYVETAKGSGKSPKAAGVGLYGLVADNEPRAEIYAGAVHKDQAKVLFRDAVAMVKQSPALLERVKISGGPGYEHNLNYTKKASFFRPISTENSGIGQSGPRPHIGLLDEVHEHRTNAMVEFMVAGQKDRRQPLIFMITNSGVDRTSVCYHYHEYAIKVAAGQIEDDSFFSYVCALDEEEDPLNAEDDEELGYPVCWEKANPSLSYGLPQVKYLKDQVQRAKGMPAKESIVRRLNFCQWVDAASPWISGDAWRACEVEDLEIEPGRDLYVALDLSGKKDLTALAMVSPDEDGGYDAEVRFWSPRDTLIERENLDRVPYWQWYHDGELLAPSGSSLDYLAPALMVAQMADRIRVLAFDPYRMEDFARELDKLGVEYEYWEGPDKPVRGTGLLLVRHGQGFGGGNASASLWMPRSIGRLEDAILKGRLKVRKNPVLTWNSASAVLESDAQGNHKFEKRKSTGRIDGIVALSMAMGAADVLANQPVTTRRWLL